MDERRLVVNGVHTMQEDVSHFFVRTLPKEKVTLYAWNILVHSTEHAAALPYAMRTLMSDKEEIRRIRATIGHLVRYDLAVVIVLYALNNALSDYFHQKDNNQHAPTYSFFLSSVVTLGITLYTWRTQIETLAHLMLLDAFAPAAFNAQKNPPPSSVCAAECDISRRVKGMGREVGILWANDFLIDHLNGFSYVGFPLAKIARIINHGRYITRVVTPERCERHKAMKQEFVLSLGLLFELSHWLVMQRLIARYVGPLPFPAARALQHLLLLFHVNIAAHMHVPAVDVGQATLPLDGFHYYEAGCRFVLDVFWAGLLARIPQDFSTNAQQCFSWIFQKGIYLLNEEKRSHEASFSDPAINHWRNLLLPKMSYSVSHFIADPVVALYWPNIINPIINICDAIEKQEKSMAVTIAQNIPKRVKKLIPSLLFNVYGIPDDVTKVILNLVNNEDFWPFISALKACCDRYRMTAESTLVKVPEHLNVMIEPKDEELLTERTTLPNAVRRTSLNTAQHFRRVAFNTKCASSCEGAHFFNQKKSDNKVNANTFFSSKSISIENKEQNEPTEETEKMKST